MCSTLSLCTTPRLDPTLGGGSVGWAAAEKSHQAESGHWHIPPPRLSRKGGAAQRVPHRRSHHPRRRGTHGVQKCNMFDTTTNNIYECIIFNGGLLLLFICVLLIVYTSGHVKHNPATSVDATETPPPFLQAVSPSPRIRAPSVRYPDQIGGESRQCFPPRRTTGAQGSDSGRTGLPPPHRRPHARGISGRAEWPVG